jgi:hypothetical protein
MMPVYESRILLAEATESGGHIVKTWLIGSAAGVGVRVEGDRLQSSLDLPLPDAAIERVMRRYARPVEAELEAEIAGLEPGIELGDGSSLCSFRFRPRYDVIAKDYVVWRVPGEPSLAELSTSVAAALTHLAKVVQKKALRSLGVP